MIKNRGLAFKLSISLLSVGFVVLSAILYYNYIISRNLALNDAKNDAQILTELTVARIENVLQGVENIPSNLAAVIQSRDTIRFIGTRAVIEEVMFNNPWLYGSCIAFCPRVQNRDTFYFAPYIYHANDSIVYKDLALDEYDYTSKAWYTKAKEQGRGVWSEPYFDEGGGEALMATYSVPFYRDRGHGKIFAGVVTADVSLVGLQTLIRDIKFYESGRGFLISSEGNIVTWPDIDSTAGQQVYNIIDETTAPGMIAVLNRMIKGEKGIVSLRAIGAPHNRDKWISYANVPSAAWSLGIVFLESELYAGIYELYIKLIAIGLAGFIILAFLIFYISGRFVKPIEKLAYATSKIGAGEFDFLIPSFRSNDEISQLGRSFNLMQIQLKEYIQNLKETTAQKERMESELEIASTIQQQMLPIPARIPGFEKIDYFGLLQPARQVGGDLYDFNIQDETLYFAIGDVSGKGIPAALFMAKTLTLFRAKVSSGLPPEEIANQINRDLEQYNSQSMFVTFFIGSLNMSSGDLNYTNAGHNLPFLLKQGKSPEVVRGSHGIPLGSMPGVKYSSGHMKMQAGEKLVMYTDGVSEAMNTSHELYGENRLEKLLEDNTDKTPMEIAGIIQSDVADFAGDAQQSDDITLLIIEFQ